MVGAGGPVAIDIETAPHQAEVDRLAGLLRARAETVGALKALRKLKAPATEIAALLAEGKQLAATIKYAKSAGLDPGAPISGCFRSTTAATASWSSISTEPEPGFSTCSRA